MKDKFRKSTLCKGDNFLSDVTVFINNQLLIEIINKNIKRE